MWWKDKKKLLSTLAIALVATAIVTWFYWQTRPKPSNRLPEEVRQSPKIEVEYVEQGKLPPELPADLPLEAGASLLRNEIVTVENGVEIQYIRSYYSKKTLAQNLGIYKKYLEDNGWKITSSLDEKNIKLLIATQEGNKSTFRFQVTQNSITKDITVEVMVVIRGSSS